MDMLLLVPRKELEVWTQSRSRNSRTDAETQFRTPKLGWKL